MNFRERGYNVEQNDVADGSGAHFKIRRQDGEVVVDMSVNSNQGTYTIMGAMNKYDTTNNKPRLAEMVHSIWVNDMRKNPGDLNTVMLLSVAEESTRPVMDNARNKKGSDDVTVTRNSEDPVDKEIFDEFAKTAWGKHVQKVLDLGGSGKQIESFRVQGPPNLVVKVT